MSQIAATLVACLACAAAGAQTPSATDAEKAAAPVSLAPAVAPPAATATAPATEPAPAPQPLESTATVADASVGKVVQVFPGTDRALIDFQAVSPALKAEADVAVASPSGRTCAGHVVSVDRARALAEFPSCASFAEIKPGSVAGLTEMAPPQVGPAPLASGAKENSAEDDDSPRVRVRYAVRALFDSGSKLHFDSVTLTTASGAGYSGSVDYTTDQALGLAVEALVSEPQSWGGNVGLSVESHRLDSVSPSLSGAPSLASFSVSGSPSLVLTVLYANASYRWRALYLSGGLNMAIPTVSSAPAALSALSPRSGLQLGLGVYIYRDIAVELVLRDAIVAGNTANSGGSTIELGGGSFASAELGVKYLF
jgi:hypothetical protein